MGEKSSTKKYLILVIIAMAIIIILLSAFMLFKPQIQGVPPVTKVSTPTPTPTPNYISIPTATPTPQPTATSIPAFSLILSTSTPTVDIPIHQQSTQFEVKLTQNGAKTLQFPCTVAICSPSPYNIVGATRSLIDYQVINGYGNYQYSIGSSVASMFEGHYTAFYATITDSYGVTVTSNTVTVEYYGGGLSP